MTPPPAASARSGEPAGRRAAPGIALAALVLAPATAGAHSFGQPYQLPMPYWLYIYGAMAALLLSFLVLGWFFSGEQAARPPRERPLGGHRLIAHARRLHLKALLQALVLAAFALAVVSGLIGTRDSHRNINMTFFWIVFALGGGYLCALIGNWYAALSPWRTLSDLLTGLWPGFSRGRIPYPAALGYWPAVLLYMAFIGLELLGDIKPYSLSLVLLGYTALNLAAIWLIGARAWFRHGEFFAVMFRLIAMMAPLAWRRDAKGHGRIVLRWPFAGLAGQRLDDVSLLVFLLFMLSSTAFDGLRETALWFNLFWKDPLGLLQPLLGRHPIYAYVELRPWFIAYEVAWLLFSPFLYLAVFGLFLWLGRLLTGSDLSLRELALRFGYSLLPIALVYHITHYYTLLLSQGVKIRALVSDPFGWGWNLFGTAITGRVPILPDMGLIWYSQVALILAGHVASVYLAHVEALRSFPGRRQALASQLPMLVLMVIFTGVGLWILAQPLEG